MKKVIAYLISIMCIVLLSCVTSTPIIKNSETFQAVSIVKKVKINDVEQYISIRGNDINNPIIIFLHGGPGTSVMPLSRIYNQELENHYIVVNWDQRGAGKSKITKKDYEELTIDTFVNDAYELIKLLCLDYNKNKVYLIGHSWGSLIGINLVYSHPEVIEKYFSIGQIVDVKESEKYAYRYLLEHAKISDLKTIKKIGEPVDGWYNGGYNSFYKMRDLLLKYGGVLHGNSNFEDYIENVIFSPEYGVFSISDWLYGSKNSLKTLWPNIVTKNNLFESIKKLSIPIVFLVGRHDYNTYYGLIEKYYDYLDADKKIYWFDNSGHAPNYEESGLFNSIIINEK